MLNHWVSYQSVFAHGGGLQVELHSVVSPAEFDGFIRHCHSNPNPNPEASKLSSVAG